MRRIPLAFVFSVLVAMSGAACNPFTTYVKGPLPRLDPENSRKVVLTNETGKRLTCIEFHYSAEGACGGDTWHGEPRELGTPDRHNLTWFGGPPKSGPITVDHLAVKLEGGEKVTVAEKQRVDVPGDLEIVLKPDLSVVFRTLQD